MFKTGYQFRQRPFLSWLLVLATQAWSATARADAPGAAPVTKFAVAATPTPSPALRYRLLPPFLDLTPGNAAIVYTKLAAGYGAFRSRETQELDNKISDWLDLAAEDLPRAEVERALGIHATRLAEADRAARMETCDWQLQVRSQMPWLLELPEAQGMRLVARLVALRTKLAILDHDYDAAIRSLQTGFAMARHVAEQPTLVSGLVGVAISTLMLNEVSNLMRAPEAPNLYWALRALPQPLVSLRAGMEQEQYFVDFAFPKLQDIARARYSPEQWREQLVHVASVTKDLIGDPNDAAWPAEVLAAGLATKTYPRAKQLMIAAGHAAEEVDQLPVSQVVLWGLVTEYQRLRDESFRWYYVPYWQRGTGPKNAEAEISQARRNAAGYPFTELLSAVQAAGWAEVRGERDIMARAAVEALRLHAHVNDGHLPARLADVTVAPVPVDPTTGQSFHYSLAGNTATLISDAPPGHDPVHFALHYEITIPPPHQSSVK